MSEANKTISIFNIIGNDTDTNGAVCYAVFVQNLYNSNGFVIEVLELDKNCNIKEFNSNDIGYKKNIYDKIIEGDYIDEDIRQKFKKPGSKELLSTCICKMLKAISNSKSLVKNKGSLSGLTDSFIKSYSDIHIGNKTIVPSELSMEVTSSNNDILLKYNGHYSSLPVISVNGQRYLFDSAGNLHQDLSGNVKQAIIDKFPKIKSLNPFGLDYQNNSNACGIWSVNILNQVQEFKKIIEKVK